MKPIPALACLALILPPSAFAASPEPIDPTLFAFPGAVTNPASAVSAGVALADRWLGDEPLDNPALARSRRLLVSPILQRLSRQDLRADNRRFDEQAAFIDAAGASISGPLGPVTVALYGSQPALRREENAFERGERGGPTPPAVVQSASTLREWRGGLAASAGSAEWRVGAAAEWSRRDEQYEYHEQSGSPDAGDRSVSFSGGGLGFQAGVRWEAPAALGRPAALGLAVRFLPAIDLDGDQVLATLVRDTTVSVAARLQSATEIGASGRIGIGPAFQVLAGGGVKSRRHWEGFGVESGEVTTWTIGGQYHDREEPWTVRFGIGQERQKDMPEPRAGLLGLGIGWRWEGSGLDFGVLHRSLERTGHPTSSDDRLVATYHLDF